MDIGIRKRRAKAAIVALIGVALGVAATAAGVDLRDLLIAGTAGALVGAGVGLSYFEQRNEAVAYHQGFSDGHRAGESKGQEERKSLQRALAAVQEEITQCIDEPPAPDPTPAKFWQF